MPDGSTLTPEQINYSLVKLLGELLSSFTAFVESQIDKDFIRRLKLNRVTKQECQPLIERMSLELGDFSAAAGPGEDIDTSAEVTEEFLSGIEKEYPILALVGRNYIGAIDSENEEAVTFTVQMLITKARVFIKNFEHLINELE